MSVQATVDSTIISPLSVRRRAAIVGLGGTAAADIRGVNAVPPGSDYTQHVVESFKQYAAVGVEGPTIGFYSETGTCQALIADQRLGDGVTAIVAVQAAARRPDAARERWAQQRRRSSAHGVPGRNGFGRLNGL